MLDRFGPLFLDSKGNSTWAILFSGLKLLHLLGMGLITAAFIGEHIGMPGCSNQHHPLYSSQALQAQALQAQALQAQAQAQAAGPGAAAQPQNTSPPAYFRQTLLCSARNQWPGDAVAARSGGPDTVAAAHGAAGHRGQAQYCALHQHH